MNIGNNLVKLREEKGLKQNELAKMINVSDKTISSYENNRSLPNIEILVLIANALETNIDRCKDTTFICDDLFRSEKSEEKKNNSTVREMIREYADNSSRQVSGRKRDVNAQIIITAE